MAPGLYRHEKRLALPLLVSSIFLFYAGIVFSFYVVFPLMFAFFTATTPEGVAMMTDISQYLDFVLKMFFAFGLAFEVPIVTIVLTITGVTNADKLAEKRPYIIVGSFVVGMLLTPPDIISQTLLAIPIWLLFELGVVFSRMIGNKKAEREAQEDAGSDSASGTTSDTVATATATAGAGVAAATAAAAATTSSEESTTQTHADTASEDISDNEESRYRPMTDEEMEAELDAIEREEDDDEDEEGP